MGRELESESESEREGGNERRQGFDWVKLYWSTGVGIIISRKSLCAIMVESEVCLPLPASEVQAFLSN